MARKDILKLCKTFCEKSYGKSYSDYMKGKKDTKSTRAKARKHAIGKTALNAMKKYQSIPPETIWHILNRVHIKSYSGADIDPAVVDKILSARQSWVKSSGHAFEEMMKAECNEALADTDIVVFLQRDLSKLLKKKKISNLVKDIDWLKDVCKTDVFDLYISKKEADNYHVFGCIQAKTSVRDRVSRDREPSIKAMERKFWSIAFIFDAAFLHMDKFITMVNGGGNNFATNGWHSVFSYEPSYNLGRIKYIGRNLSTFVSEAKEASIKFTGEERALRTTDYPEE